MLSQQTHLQTITSPADNPVGVPYHVPALLLETLTALDIRANGTYVDATYGGGGHSREILRRLGPEGKLIAFDQDTEALNNLANDPRLTLVHANFRHLADILEYMGAAPVDGLLADLGVSSHHFDDAARGFSFRAPGPLDMRMSPSASTTAADIVQNASEDELTGIFRDFGEVDRPARLAQALIRERQNTAPWTTQRLRALVERTCSPVDIHKTLAKVFQSLRIVVNGEMESLAAMLRASTDVVRPGGRLAVISYHSLEDRMVKNLLRSGDPATAAAEVDVIFGGARKPWKPGCKRPIEPDDDEVLSNPRVRSAKLRWGTRL